MRLKRSDEGIRELETALDLKPDDYEARLSLGFAYKQKGDYKHAIEHLQKATELKPDDPQGWTNLGVAKSKTDDKEGAIVALKKAIALKPDDAELHFDLARGLPPAAQHRRGDRRVPGRGRRRTPSSPRPTTTSACMYSQERKNPEARAAFEKYLEYGTHEDAGAAQGRRGAPEDLQGPVSVDQAGLPTGTPPPARQAAHAK